MKTTSGPTRCHLLIKSVNLLAYVTDDVHVNALWVSHCFSVELVSSVTLLLRSHPSIPDGNIWNGAAVAGPPQ